jgi:nucleotide-binding universal stress UspA family protein
MIKIIIPIDFSAASKQALKYASFIANQTELHTELILLHVFDIPISITDSYVYSIPAEEILKMKENHLVHLKELTRSLTLKSNKISLRAEVLTGFPEQEIISFVKNENADLVIMGIQGRCMRPSYFMGSIFIQLMNTLDIPVIALHGTTAFSDLKNILLAYDLQHLKNKSSLDSLIQLAKSFKANIHILHISKNPENNITELYEMKRAFRFLEEEFPTLRFYVNNNSDIVSGIKEFIRSQPVDLICCLPHAHNYLSQILKSSESRKAAFELNPPFMTINN